MYYLAMDVSGDAAGTNHRPAPPEVESASEMHASKREVGSASTKMPRRRQVQEVVLDE